MGGGGGGGGGLAHEREHVVFAHAVEADIADQYDFVVLFGEEFLEVLSRFFMQAVEQLGIHSGNAGGRLDEAFSVRVFAHGQKNFTYSRFDSRHIDPVGQVGLLFRHFFVFPSVSQFY